MSGQVKKISGNISLCKAIIANILKALDLEQRDFALKSGIAPDTLQKSIDRGKFSREIIRSIHDSFGVNPDYLREMKGEMFDKKHTPAIKTEQADISEHPLVKSYVSELNTLKEYIAFLKRENEELRGKK